MENIIVKDDIVLGFTKEVKKYFRNEVDTLIEQVRIKADRAGRFERAEYLIDEIAGYVSSIEEIRDLLKELEKEDEEELICVEMNPMGSFFYNRVAVYTNEKEKRLILL